MTTGAVAVIGGGIGGMQSSLDLAEAGFKVYLIDNSPAIGGTMARLDKTFPTNDCAMCVMSPKLVECARHLNIDIITNADIEGLSGEAGNFKIEIRKRARFVDEDKCTGCGECWNNCPVRNRVFIPEELPEEIYLNENEREEVDRIIDRYKGEEGILVSVLDDINSKLNYLSKDVLKYVSMRLKIPQAQVLRVATFYNAFSLVPRGRHLINVCLGTTCFVKGVDLILEKMERYLEVRTGETTGDNRFTLKAVHCLGCCAIAPAVKIDNDIFGRLKQEDVEEILELYR